MTESTTRYLRPRRGTNALQKTLVGGLARLGVSVRGAHQLVVRGRNSGQWHSTPVFPLRHAGSRYLVAPRGHTQWVRNLRVAGEGTLRVGRGSRTFSATELADEEKPAILRAYLTRWPETRSLFPGVHRDSTEASLRESAAGLPVFRITLTS
ncbi:deazaflavin-dependent oxidoreductase (nitroreductase family) [Tamaricihabitans halophyticus]|uniref:Deazaflavin-dependent oxidoreductase (Nitroreductase family) n=1 Tax=Tamaricihabitans halophyticus TaxID=1262583 RepID=A0A4R2PY14_9PSEU|nr:nitroreductase family deazaflavin-dependent oxidoreductase [Tamaricihabitans halophyticus]TCP41123.1 deazaflavin-dependent oxidoreductase (nitroreductase family) [Tamaricihabitans halophyticus]